MPDDCVSGESAAPPWLTEALADPRLGNLKRENLHRLASDLDEGRSVFESRPDVVSLHTTEICNLRCKMCYRSVAPGRLQLSRSVLEKVGESLFPTARIVRMLANLGEPLLGDADLVFSMAREHGVAVDLLTNGTLLTPELYAEERDVLARVNVSMDSHRPEVYEKIRRGSRFDRLEHNLRGIRELRRERRDGVFLSISCVVMRSNVADVAGFVRFAGRMEIDAVVFQMLRHFAFPVPDEELESPSRITADRGGGRQRSTEGFGAYPEGALEDVRRAAVETGTDVYFGDFDLPPIQPSLRWPRIPLLLGIPHCNELFTNLAVYPSGDVYPCCTPTSYHLGNVVREDPVAIWNSRRSQRLRRAHFSGHGTAFCRSCIAASGLSAPKPLRDSVTRRAALQATRVRAAVHQLRTSLRAVDGISV